MLIDCGVHSAVSGGSDFMDRVVDDIASVTKRIDVLVLTHEHWDHNSAFSTAAEKFGAIEFADIWLAWTENPDDPQAKELDKFKQDAVSALQKVASKLTGAGVSSQMGAIGAGVDNMLGFYFGLKGEKVRDARNSAIKMARRPATYHEPGAGPLQLKDAAGAVEGVNVYVLGPPRDAKLLGVTERSSEMYGMGAAVAGSYSNALMSGFGMGGPARVHVDDAGLPFDPEIGFDLAESVLLAAAPTKTSAKRDRGRAAAHELLRTSYLRSGGAHDKDVHELHDQSWRRIDGDWLGVSAELAMQLDDRTNNTSLVLAFELLPSKRVLLFTGDAQVGNLLSWQALKWGDLTGPHLLERTVYLKVGHHGSHNATLRAKELEQMTDRDLSAFIPVNEKDAKKVRWGQMPYKRILERLESLTGGRTIRADDEWVKDAGLVAPVSVPGGAIKALRRSPQPGLWVEVDIA